MSQPEADSPLDDQLLSDLYRERRVGWEKLLTSLGLPTNIGIVKTMTLGEAKAFAAGRSKSKTSEESGASAKGALPSRTTSAAVSQSEQVAAPTFSLLDLDSITAAVREEIAAAHETVRTAWLDIDAIEHLSDRPGSFVYRLILSSPVHFGSDQTVTFHTRNPNDTIQAVIVRSDDEGLVGDYIVRTNPNCPPVFVAGGTVCVPYRGKWLAVASPNVSRVIWRIGFSHLADDEVDPAQARRFFCPECSDGDLVLRQQKGEGWFLVCTNGQKHTCHHRRRLSLEDAKVKVRLGNRTCSKKHPMTVRQSSTRFFLGCENYPACDYTESLSILEGT